MRKKLIFIQIIICLLVASSSSSQPGFGIKVGATFYSPQTNNTSMAAGNPGYGGQYKQIEGGPGILLGVFVPIALTQSVYLRPSAETAFRTIKAETSGMFGSYQLSHPVNYLDIPVPVTYVIQKKRYRIFLGAGPSLSLLLNRSYQFLQFTNETDIGINGLIAIENKIGFSLNLNYIHGLSTLTAEKNLKNRFVNLSVGYLF